MPGTYTTTTTSIVPPNTCGALTRQRAQLFARVAGLIFTVTNGNHAEKTLDSLIIKSRALGDAEGLLAACLTPPNAISQVLKQQREQAKNDLAFTEANLKKAKQYKDWNLWLSLRTKIQAYHAAIAKLAAWRAKIAADKAAAAAQAAATAQTQAEAEAARLAAEQAKQEAAEEIQDVTTAVDDVDKSASGGIGKMSRTLLWIGGIGAGGLLIYKLWSR